MYAKLCKPTRACPTQPLNTGIKGVRIAKIAIASECGAWLFRVFRSAWGQGEWIRTNGSEHWVVIRNPVAKE